MELYVSLRTHPTLHRVIKWLVFATLTFTFLCTAASLPSVALENQAVRNFVWQTDKSTGSEIAASLSAPSLNFFDVGDLSMYSLYLVQSTLSGLSDATGINVDRSLKNSLIAIFHDTKVFSRLKTDRQAFTALGIPDDVLDDISQRVPDDAKCFTTTRTDAKGDIVFTVILLSEKFNDCLMGGL